METLNLICLRHLLFFDLQYKYFVWNLQLNTRIQTLEEALNGKEKDLQEEKAKFSKLKEDFKYNLKVLEERDQELERYDATFSGKIQSQYFIKCRRIDIPGIDQFQVYLNIWWKLFCFIWLVLCRTEGTAKCENCWDQWTKNPVRWCQVLCKQRNSSSRRSSKTLST